MEMKNILTTLLGLVFLLACSPPSVAATKPVDQATATAILLTPSALPSTDTQTPSALPATDTPVPAPALPTETLTLPPPTETSAPTPIPFIGSLKATVTADKLVCRYGPGANYLYLFAFIRGANIKLIGRADGNKWVLVENVPQRCWINSEFVQIQGDPHTLKSTYPDGYKIPVSPYYGPTTVTGATREADKVIVSWSEVIVSPGKYEDENMFPYIVEVWRCEAGEIIFDTLGSRVPFIAFVDQAGCDTLSHGRVYVQEKHGYAGPAEIPWPASNP
jgi:uncharacterized protein YraI